ncbi:hypothetical protein AMJ83_07820 [candidate division WOR_3 bacterium SM23_42]|uniref:Uncharacterized protein n=1 Tax=candidate division WOR_3 bacterium SM23_42 TaxID=1703779 RepID=A0A0S8FT01_UNCW3|nr:MAG: hypothetical protein AMJ83_07820 [candidate division WOR_3 bacterium SM23_42]
MGYRVLLVVFLLLVCTENNIVQRAAEDYFPLREGSWWQYANQSDTVLVEVEPQDTILQVPCFPVSYNGVPAYLVKHDDAVSQYIRTVYNHAGSDHTVMENFVVRIELPLIEGNAYQHLLSDSIYVASQLIKAVYELTGLVVGYADETGYGNVYEINLTTIESITTPDTVIADTNEVTEYYAPGIGMVRFQEAASEYHLIEYNIP